MKPKNRSISKINHKPGQVHIATALDGTILFCCPECQMAYSEKSYLEKHLSLHKIERRPYTCTACGKGFKRKEHLNLHIVIHSGNKTEVCGECGKGFYRKDHLRKHIKSHVSKRMKETSESFEKLTKPNYAEHKNTVYETYAHFTMGEEMEKLNKL
uniref:CSON009082 protein n=1 Tax=Culicoides sonorensis TaxID=179676 RepID=A0A336LZP7_CULSO